MPKLLVVAGPDAGAAYPLSGPAVVVGRHSTNPVPLTDARVSRRHVELRATPTGFQAVDLGSGNGTRVNGRVVQAVELRPGDRIQVGDTVLEYAADAPTARFPVDLPSAIIRTVAEDAGGRLLARPDAAATDWLRTRLASLTVMYEAADAVSRILDVDELLGRVLDLVLRTTGADHGCALLLDPDTGEPRPRAVRARPGLYPAGGGPDPELVVSRTVVDHVLASRQGVLVADAAADDRFAAGQSVIRHRLREVICVPMRGRRETVGVLFLDTQSSAGGGAGAGDKMNLLAGTDTDTGTGTASRFADDHLHLAVAVAHQAALAVEENRYYRGMLQAERLAAVGQTIAALSHHIKNIMQAVRFGSDMVRMGLAGDDKDLLSKGWRLVEKNQGKIDALILDMLSYSTAREPAAEPTDLNALAADAVEVVRGRAAAEGVTLDWQPLPGLPLVTCDPDGVHRAVLNVVSNALDAVAGRPAPRVAVAVGRAADGGAEVAVTDTGPGVPADKLADIFKPFVSTKGAKGTGLGLPVSRKILREHGGDVTAENVPGGGCRFVLRLPTGGA